MNGGTQSADLTWTPAFSLVKGVVLDGGGTLSHAAVVCREYEIPCVLNTFQVTAKIKNGQMIRVDGNEGAVYVLDQWGGRGWKRNRSFGSVR